MELLKIERLTFSKVGKTGHPKVLVISKRIKSGIIKQEIMRQSEFIKKIEIKQEKLKNFEVLSIENEFYTIYDEDEQFEEKKFKEIPKLFLQQEMKFFFEKDYEMFLQNQYNYKNIFFKIFEYENDFFINSYEFVKIEIMSLKRKDFDIKFRFY